MDKIRAKLGRNDPCWCGSGKKYKKCHMEQDLLNGGQMGFMETGDVSRSGMMPELSSSLRPVPDGIKSPVYAVTGDAEYDCDRFSRLKGEDLEKMRQTCRAARRVLDKALSAVRPGVTTNEIDAVVHQASLDEGGYPSPLNYHGFPKSVCTSVNEVICHGIPDDRPIKDGDIINVDVTLFLNGVHGDCSETVPVGDIDESSRRLIETARECLQRGIEAVRPHGMIKDIGEAVSEYAHGNGCSVVRAYCGHGIGRCFHMEPPVFHHRNKHGKTRIEPGMIFTVEPMINAGTWRHKVLDDGWTAVTADGQRSAQFEHTLLVTEDGCEVLTSIK